MSLTILYACALALATLLAFTAGSLAARRVSTAYLAAQLFAMAVGRGHFHYFKVGLMLSDVVLLGVLVWLTLRTRQHWPIACAGLQTVTVLGHLARLADPTVSRMTYAILVQWTAWPALLAILTGIVLDRRAGRTLPPFWREEAFRTHLQWLIDWSNRSARFRR